MRIANVNRNSDKSPTFKAKVIYNRKDILTSLANDVELTIKDYPIISNLLDRVDTFAMMKEKSIIALKARVNNGQVNLESRVCDRTKKIKKMIDLRAVRNMAWDVDFRERYLQSIQDAVSVTDKTRKGINKITLAILSSKNIKGIISDSEVLPINIKNVKKHFEGSSFSSFFMTSLEKQYNPTQNIIKLIEDLNGKIQNSEVYIGVVDKKKNSNVMSYFIVEVKSSSEVKRKQVLLSEIFKRPLADHFITK